jgi:hypothetical protein
MGVLDKLFKRKRSSSRSAADAPKARPENLALLQAMEAIARLDSPENRSALYRTMLQAWFLVPTNQMPGPGTSGNHVLESDTRVSIPLHRDAKGKNIVPAFTDEQALEHWSGASPWFALQGLLFFQSVASTEADEIAVNPFRPGEKIIRPFGRITRAEFQALAEGLMPERHPQGKTLKMTTMKPQRVLVGMPAEMPRKEVFEALSSAAKSQPIIRALYFCQIAFAEGAPHRAVAIDFLPGISPEDADAGAHALGSAIQPLLPGGELFDFFPSGTTLADAIMKQGKKIYSTSLQ